VKVPFPYREKAGLFALYPNLIKGFAGFRVTLDQVPRLACGR
jgi:hypothetical protein